MPSQSADTKRRIDTLTANHAWLEGNFQPIYITRKRKTYTAAL